jgi:hypothetical protein
MSTKRKEETSKELRFSWNDEKRCNWHGAQSNPVQRRSKKCSWSDSCAIKHVGTFGMSHTLYMDQAMSVWRCLDFDLCEGFHNLECSHISKHRLHAVSTNMIELKLGYEAMRNITCNATRWLWGFRVATDNNSLSQDQWFNRSALLVALEPWARRQGHPCSNENQGTLYREPRWYAIQVWRARFCGTPYMYCVPRPYVKKSLFFHRSPSINFFINISKKKDNKILFERPHFSRSVVFIQRGMTVARFILTERRWINRSCSIQWVKIKTTPWRCPSRPS